MFCGQQHLPRVQGTGSWPSLFALLVVSYALMCMSARVYVFFAVGKKHGRRTAAKHTQSENRGEIFGSPHFFLLHHLPAGRTHTYSRVETEHTLMGDAHRVKRETRAQTCAAILPLSLLSHFIFLNSRNVLLEAAHFTHAFVARIASRSKAKSVKRLFKRNERCTKLKLTVSRHATIPLPVYVEQCVLYVYVYVPQRAFRFTSRTSAARNARSFSLVRSRETNCSLQCSKNEERRQEGEKR